MFLETIFLSLVGISIGVIAGIVPGMHVNTLIPLIFLFSSLLNLSPHQTVIFIVSVAEAEIFLNFIPSIFLGAPDEDSSLAVLPGHRLLMEGRGYEAIKLVVIGGIGALFLSLIIIFLLSNIFSLIYKISRPYIHFLILAVVGFMIYSEKEKRKMLSALLIILLSGFLGIIVLNSNLVSQQNSLFPLLTGLFGASTLLISISERASIPKQKKENDLKISRRDLIKSIFLGSIAGILIGFLPAIGISEAATLVQYIGGTGEARSFLVTLSGINVGNEVFSLISLFLVSNPRSGASVAIQRVLGGLTFYEVVLIIGVVCFVSGIAGVLTLFLGRKIPKYLEKVNYKLLSVLILILITSIVFILTGLFGLLILFTSSCIGITCALLGIRRSHCMGCLLLPTILFFSNLTPNILTILRL